MQKLPLWTEVRGGYLPGSWMPGQSLTLIRYLLAQTDFDHPRSTQAGICVAIL